MQNSYLICLLPLLAVISCHREHKVHNIVLYPDKQSWCKTTPIKQVVGEPGYESTTVENSVCVGTCFSYSIPHTSDITITPYCDSCQPSETHWFHVTLPKLANADEELGEYPNQDVSTPLPDTIQKQVQIITNCTCLSCMEQLNNQKNMIHANTTELPKNLLANYGNKKEEKQQQPSKGWVDDGEKSKSSSEEMPDVLHLMNRTRTTNRTDLQSQYKREDMNVTAVAHRYLLNTKLINLIKNIQNHSDDVKTEKKVHYDRELLSELLAIIEGSENHLSDKNLMEFVNFVNVHNSEDFELDLSQLKTVLTQYLHDKLGPNAKKADLQEKHRQFGLNQLHKDGKVASIEYASLVNSGEHHKHDKHHHFAGEHINIAATDDNAHQHNQIGEGHLVNGPHGSLIVQPDDDLQLDTSLLAHDNIQEKLNMEPHQLQPNHEGTIINYQSQKDDKKQVIIDQD